MGENRILENLYAHVAAGDIFSVTGDKVIPLNLYFKEQHRLVITRWIRELHGLGLSLRPIS